MTLSGGTLSSPAAELVASLLREGFEVRLRLSGWSMKPLLSSGSVVRFAPPGGFRRGDVVLARHRNGALVAHRVVALDETTVWTKGDACRSLDAAVPRERVVGRAVALEERFFFPLPIGSAAMRILGLALNRLLPPLAQGLRILLRRARRGEAAPC